MPAYGKNLSPQEVDALVAYLETLHKPGQKPAVDEADKLIQQQKTNNPAPAVPPVGNAGSAANEQQLQSQPPMMPMMPMQKQSSAPAQAKTHSAGAMKTASSR
jgi:hypothetical protein